VRAWRGAARYERARILSVYRYHSWFLQCVRCVTIDEKSSVGGVDRFSLCLVRVWRSLLAVCHLHLITSVVARLGERHD